MDLPCSCNAWGQFLTLHFLRAIKRERVQTQELTPLSRTFGMSSAGRLLVIAHTERKNAIRIISARVVTQQERRIYEEG